MEDLAFDWLSELERGIWERRIRALRQELATQRLLAAKQKPVAQDVAPQNPVAAELMQPQQLQLALEQVTSPSPLETRQKLIRLVDYK